MSKEFFAIYLPVEGEIKEGDKYIDKLVRMSLPDFAPITYSGVVYEKDELNGRYKTPILQSIEGTTTPLNQAQKVKLFLCSRDLKIDDNIQFYLSISRKFDKGKVKDIWEDGHIEIYNDWIVKNPEDCFKVIGEISPEATWVKEGDEFDDDEVITLITDPNDPEWFADYYCKEDWSEELEMGFKIVCKIKGPCGHFH